MWNSLLIALNVILPMAVLMGIGAVTRTCRLVSREDMRPLDKLLVKLFMPCLLFKNIYSSDFSSHFHAAEVAFTLVSIFLLYLLASFLPPKYVADQKQAASAGQALFRCNFVLFGLAVAESIYGRGNAGLTALLGAFIIPLTNALSVLYLERARSSSASVKQLFLAVLSNPMVIAALLALGLTALKVNIPPLFLSIIADVAGVTSVLSFFSLGVSLNIGELRKNQAVLAKTVLIRMLVIPVLFLPLAVLAGFRGQSLCAMIILFSAPTAISSYPMAVTMDADGPLAGQLVCATTLVSVVTMFLIVFFFQVLGML